MVFAAEGLLNVGELAEAAQCVVAVAVMTVGAADLVDLRFGDAGLVAGTVLEPAVIAAAAVFAAAAAAATSAAEQASTDRVASAFEVFQTGQSVPASTYAVSVAPSKPLQILEDCVRRSI